MKKFKLLNILLVIAFIFSMPLVHAHEIELRNDAIKIEKNDEKIYSWSKILVDEEKLELAEDDEYTLYYQYVKIDNTAYDAYLKKHKEQEEYKQNFLEENNLTDINDGTSEQIKTHNAAVKAFDEEKEKILPSFVESDWVKTTDATAKLDLTKVPENSLGYQPYVLWMKVESSDKTVTAFYGDQVVTAIRQATDPENNEKVAETGDEILLVALGALIVGGVMVVSYKKVNA